MRDHWLNFDLDSGMSGSSKVVGQLGEGVVIGPEMDVAWVEKRNVKMVPPERSR